MLSLAQWKTLKEFILAPGIVQVHIWVSLPNQAHPQQHHLVHVCEDEAEGRSAKILD